MLCRGRTGIRAQLKVGERPLLRIRALTRRVGNLRCCFVNIFMSWVLIDRGTGTEGVATNTGPVQHVKSELCSSNDYLVTESTSSSPQNIKLFKTRAYMQGRVALERCAS